MRTLKRCILTTALMGCHTRFKKTFLVWKVNRSLGLLLEVHCADPVFCQHVGGRSVVYILQRGVGLCRFNSKSLALLNQIVYLCCAAMHQSAHTCCCTRSLFLFQFLLRWALFSCSACRVTPRKKHGACKWRLWRLSQSENGMSHDLNPLLGVRREPAGLEYTSVCKQTLMIKSYLLKKSS